MPDKTLAEVVEFQRFAGEIIGQSGAGNVERWECYGVPYETLEEIWDDIAQYKLSRLGHDQ